MTSRRCFPILVLALSTAVGLACAQAPSGNLLAVQPIPKVSAKRGESFAAKAVLTLQQGLHVHSNKPNDEYLIPIKLTWQADPLRVESIEYPKAKIEPATGFSDKPLSVFDGTFEITTKFSVPATAQQGMGLVTGKLRYQACNDRMCFPPKTVDVKLSYDLR